MTDTVVVRHGLEHVPLAPPSRTSGLLEVFRRRYLLRLMVRREIKARYAGSVIGLAWSYINPAIRFLTFFLVFGILLGRGMGLENFAIHLFAGMVLVNYFTTTVNSATKSLLSNKGVVQKMAVPREMFPFASMLVSLWHAGPQLVILIIACIATGIFGDGPMWVPDAAGLAAALLGFLIVMLLATALGLLFCCINVLFRDFGRVVGTFINMVPFSVPMMYPYWIAEARFPGIWHDLYVLNPVAEAVMLIQRGFWYPTCAPACSVDPVTGGELPEFVGDLWSRGFLTLGFCVALLAFAQWVFTKLEKRVPERLG